MKTLYVNNPYNFDIAVLDNFGNFVSGLLISYEVRLASDDSLITNDIMTEINSKYTFVYTFISLGEYRIIYNTPVGYDNGFENILIIVDSSTLLTNIDSGVTYISGELEAHRQETELRIKYILGLSQSNFRIINQNYDSNNLLISSTIRTYSNNIDAFDDVNPLKEYSMNASYDSSGRITSYVVLEV